MDKELIKEIIRMFLNEEREVYTLISEMSTKEESREKAKNYVSMIDFLSNHIEKYDSTIEIICENLNKKEKSTRKTK